MQAKKSTLQVWNMVIFGKWGIFWQVPMHSQPLLKTNIVVVRIRFSVLSHFDWRRCESTAICESPKPTNCPVQLAHTLIFGASQSFEIYIYLFANYHHISPVWHIHTVHQFLMVAIGWHLQNQNARNAFWFSFGFCEIK